MTNEEQKLREFVSKYVNDDNEPTFLSDLTALISERYVSKEKHNKVVQQRDELRRIMGHMIRLMEDSEYATVNQQTALQLAKEAIKLTER